MKSIITVYVFMQPGGSALCCYTPQQFAASQHIFLKDPHVSIGFPFLRREAFAKCLRLNKRSTDPEPAASLQQPALAQGKERVSVCND